MPHPFAGAFQQTGRVFKDRPVEKADIYMSSESVDVANCGISHTGRGMAIVQKLTNVRTAAAHLLKPWKGELS
ncbi:MAG TPA: hypothetical protein VGL35_00430 [Rhizomicrobium sp.]